jgi:hypothetical protein
VWCSLRGWSKDEQRAVFQPVAVAIFAMTALWLGGTGLLAGDTIRLFAIGLPAVLTGRGSASVSTAGSTRPAFASWSLSYC